MTKAELLKQIEPYPNDTQICVYEDNSYWNIKPVSTVIVMIDRLKNMADETVKNGAIVLSGCVDAP